MVAKVGEWRTGDPTKKVPQLNFGNENNRNAVLARSPPRRAAPALVRAREAEIAFVDRQN